MKPELDEKGFCTLVVGATDSRAAREAIESFGATLDIVIDSKRTIYRAFGYGRIMGVLQKSGTVVIESPGVIRYIHWETNPRHSLRRDDFMMAVDALAPHATTG